MTRFLAYVANAALVAAVQLLFHDPDLAILLAVTSMLAASAVELWLALTGGIFT